MSAADEDDILGAFSKTRPLKVLDPRDWHGPAPAREWIVPEWVPAGVVTALYGDGGVGKSLASQQLLNSVALALPWFGLQCRGGRALGIFCEDDEDELWRRQERINAALGVGMENLENLRLVSRFGEDNALIHFDGAAGFLTPFHAQIMGLCHAFRPSLVVLDTAADLYPDNENDRSKVRQFIQAALGVIAKTFRCGVIVCAHPSAAGLASGSGTGGSTAWSNTVRSRLYLTRPDEEDDDARLLTRKKANYARRSDEIRLRWQGGVLAVDDAIEDTKGLPWATINAIFDELQQAWDEARAWSHIPQTRGTGRYFPDFAERAFKINPDFMSRLLTEWLGNGYLRYEQINSISKSKGLRVMRRLRP